MGFETQEEAEQWAEGVEMRADARREERLLKTETDERNSIKYIRGLPRVSYYTAMAGNWLSKR